MLSRTRLPRWKPSWTMMAVLLLAAFILRAWALGFGLPNESRPDELANSQTVMHNLLMPFLSGDFSLHPHRFNYPSVYYYVTFVLYLHYYAVGVMAGWFSSMEGFYKAYLNDPTSFHLILRWLSVVAGTASVWAMYRLGKTAASKTIGWLTAILAAGCYMLVRNDHFGTIDSLMMLPSILALQSIVRYAQKPEDRYLKHACMLVGIATGVKYPAILLLTPLLVIQFRRSLIDDVIDWRGFFKQALATTGWTLLVFLLTSPWLLLDINQFIQDFRYESQYYYFYSLPGMESGWTFYPRIALWYGLGGVLFLASLFGIALVQRKSVGFSAPMVHAALLSYLIAVYVLTLGPNYRILTRYALPVVPVLLVYASLAVGWLVPRLITLLQTGLNRRLPAIAVMTILTALVMMESLQAVYSFNRILSRPDTRDDARNWILAFHMPGQPIAAGPRFGSIILPATTPRLLLDPQPVPPGYQGDIPTTLSPWMNNDRLIPTYASEDAFRQYKIDTVVLFGGLPMMANSPDEMQRLIPSNELMLHASPLKNGIGRPEKAIFDWMDAFYVPYARFEEFERPGPEVFIVRLKPKSSKLSSEPGKS